MRTPEEILEKCKNGDDLLGFTSEALVPYLTFEQAKPLLKEDARKEDWGEVKPLTREQVLKDMAEYMDFAWGKVQDHRGISASRSVDKMKAWVWLLGDAEVLDAIEEARYEQYGAPKLKVVCDSYGFTVPESKAIQHMVMGMPCTSDCEEGCGR